MRSPLRFSVRGLLAAVTLFALGMAAFVSASELWASTIFLLAVASLGVALIVVCTGRAGSRTFAIGYLVIGTLYLALFLSCFRSDFWQTKLVTSRLIDWAFQFRAVADTRDAYPGERESPKLSDERFGYIELRPGAYMAFGNLQTHRNVALSGHCFLVIAFGCAGGALATFVAGRQ